MTIQEAHQAQIETIVKEHRIAMNLLLMEIERLKEEVKNLISQLYELENINLKMKAQEIP